MKTRNAISMLLGVLFIAASAQAQDAGQGSAEDDPAAQAIDALYAAQSTAEEVEALEELAELLSVNPDPWIADVLGETLQSDNPETRRAAMMGLSAGSAQHPDVLDLAVLDQVRATAEAETDAGSRIRAVGVLASQDASRDEGMAMLETLAEQEDDGAAQKLARQRLQEIEASEAEAAESASIEASE